jgi:hypothetical protein
LIGLDPLSRRSSLAFSARSCELVLILNFPAKLLARCV